MELIDKTGASAAANGNPASSDRPSGRLGGVRDRRQPLHVTLVCSTGRTGERPAQACGEREAVRPVGRVGMISDEGIEDGHELVAG